MQNYYKMFKDGVYLDVFYHNITDLTISSNWFDTNSVFYMCYHLYNLTNCNIDFWKGTAKDFSLESTFEGCSSLTNINVSNWNMTNVSSLRNTFTGCSNLISLDVSNWDVSNVKDMSYLFSDCSNLTNLDISNWNVRNVVDISSLFSYCSNLTNLNLSNWNFTKLKKIEWTFADCSNLTNLDISNWNVSQVSSLSGTFSDLDCSIFANSLKKWDVKNVTNFSNTFKSCPNLNLLIPIVQNWNFSNVKNIDYLFGFPSLDGSQNLSLVNLNICNVEHADFVFACPSNLKTLDISGWNACNVKNLYGFIERGSNLENVYMNNWNLASLQYVDGCFTGVRNNCNIWVPNLKIKRIFLNDRTATNLTNIRISSALDWDVLDNIIGSVGTIKSFSIPYEGSLVFDHPNDFSVSVSPISSSFFNVSTSIDTVNQIITLEVEGIEGGEDSITITLQDSQGHSISQTILTTITASICSYEVVDLETTYKFILNANDYYESNNKAQHNSFALCKLKFKTDTGKLILDCINYAEASYDYGILSNVDTTLTSSYNADSSNVYKKFNTAAMNTSAVQTVTYTINDTNEHFIYIKYRKDSSASSNNDSLQFKVRFE